MASNGTYNVTWLESKLAKWMKQDNPDKVADYLVRYCDTESQDAEFASLFVGNVPPIKRELNFPQFNSAIRYLESRGYLVTIKEYKGKDRLIVVWPDRKSFIYSKHMG